MYVAGAGWIGEQGTSHDTTAQGIYVCVCVRVRVRENVRMYVMVSVCRRLHFEPSLSQPMSPKVLRRPASDDSESWLAALHSAAVLASAELVVVEYLGQKY